MATGRVPTTANSPLTAKGDLFTYDTSQARLAVGNNGETLVADSSQTTGLRYNTPVASLANPVINGGFDVWQRGTSGFIGTAFNYSADRWQIVRASFAAGLTVSRQLTSDTTNLPNIQYAARVQRDSGNSGTGTVYIAQSLETVNSLPFAGKTVTLSFYARAGANYSPTSSLLNVQLATGTGTDQNYLSGGGYTGGATSVNSNATLTTTWQRFAFTGSIPSSATEIGIQFSATPTGTASTNDWFEITGVQIDIGTWTASTAPTFRRSGGTLAGELAACQRYYYEESPLVGSQFNTTVIGKAAALHPVEMRTSPTVTVSNTTSFQAGNITLTATGTITNYSNTRFLSLDLTTNSAGSAGWAACKNAGTGKITVSAEL